MAYLFYVYCPECDETFTASAVPLGQQSIICKLCGNLDKPKEVKIEKLEQEPVSMYLDKKND